jgi:hypothetical protein
LCALALACEKPTKPKDEAAKPVPVVKKANPAPAPAPTRTGADVARAREKLDETVWKDEVEAQRHEQVFVDLWDALRASQWNAEPVLAAFAFDTIAWADPGPGRKLEAGIGQRQAQGASKIRNRGQWVEELSRWSEADYRLIQSEWHHGRFEAVDGDRPAKSTINMVLHVEQRSDNRRLIVKGKVSVDWRSGPKAKPRAGKIEIRDLEILERVGAPNFVESVAVEDSQQPLLPLLAEDIDADGDIDVLLPGHNRLLRNTGGTLSSEDLFVHPPPTTETETNVAAAVLADLDGDGILDILTTAKDTPPRLFIGSKGGVFSKPARIISLPTGAQHHPSAMTAGDIDGDGDIDLWLTQYKDPFIAGQMPTPYYDANDGYPATLLINDGKGGFSDGTEAAGLAPRRYRRTYSTSLVDLDGDHDLDLVVVSDFSGVDGYRNDGQGRFEDMNSTWLKQRHTFGMSHTFGDYDLDGEPDLYVTGMSSTTARRLTAMGLGRKDRDDIHRMRPAMGYGNRAYLLGAKRFAVAPFNADLARSGWTWGSVSFDMENDGDTDIYLANGHISGKTVSDYCTEFWRHDIYTGSSENDPAIGDFYDQSIRRQRRDGLSWNGFEHNHLFVNTKGRGFRNLAWLAGAAQEDDARSVASVDLDNDGLRDLLVAVSPSPRSSKYRLLRLDNRSQRTGHWIGFRLRGAPGRSPIGAKVTLIQGKNRRVARVLNGDSFLTQHPTTVHFGLGKGRRVDGVEIRWPDGTTQVMKKPVVDRYHVVKAQAGSN